ncbi:MAG: ATP-binding protein [Phycisphaerales bacterium]|nr:ATP-binding protein [Phycisphaerales bacterium]MDG2132061.1 ATP-binding protein [Phycisphaerales bacterium]
MLDVTTISGVALAFVAGLAAAWMLFGIRIRRACISPGDARGSTTPIRALDERLRRELEALSREHVLARRIVEERIGRFERMFASFPDPILVLDRHGDVVDANPAAKAIAKIGADDDVRIDAVSPRSLEDMIGNRTAVRDVLEHVRAVVAAGSEAVRNAEFELDSDDPAGVGEETSRAFEAVIRTLDEHGRALLVLHDTTRERDSSRLKSEFVAKASHELRTPLSSIHASLEMLADGDLQDHVQRAEFLDIAIEETDRLAKLVNDMLDISGIEAGVARPRMTQVDLAEIATDVVDGLRAAADRRSVDLRLHVQPGLVVEGDPEMLSAVIGNLVGNGLKYVPEGERVTVAVDAEDLTRSVVVTVTDTGLGIPPGDLDRVFDKFYRIKRYERNARGTGLGLNLCRNIVEQVHHGRIGVDSRLGEGARFWFSVPASHPASMAA